MHKTNKLFLLIILSFLTSTINFISNNKEVSMQPESLLPIGKSVQYHQNEEKTLFEPIRIWNGSLAISWITFAHVYHGIKSDLICSQWRSKIS